jgi:hypothetical protein
MSFGEALRFWLAQRVAGLVAFLAFALAIGIAWLAICLAETKRRRP